jgi:2,4-dienoyl-CoA reductase-like NADH-dependent reductase (Old Yellow Enzyme family)
MPHLFEPFTLRGVTLRNRIGIPPMCQYSYQDGFSNEWQLVHLGTRAAGGAGLIIAEAAAVEPRGRITPNDVGIWSDAHIEPLAKVSHIIKSQGAVAGIQIAHAGRKANTNRPWDGGSPISENDPRWWQVIGPSAIAFSSRHQTPKEMTLEDIQATQQLFRQAAERTLAAGFEWLELHAAHGYLIHSFYSPLSNHREDAYGGSFENRVRFLLETVQTMRAVWPERLPFTVRISGTDWHEYGWTVEDSVVLGKMLKQNGVDLVDCSSGGNAPDATIPFGPNYQVHISESVRGQAGIPTAAVGLITQARQADQIIRDGQADIVLLGREMLRNPTWPIQAAKELGYTAPIPAQYLRAY